MIFDIYYHSRFNPPFLEDFPTTHHASYRSCQALSLIEDTIDLTGAIETMERRWEDVARGIPMEKPPWLDHWRIYSESSEYFSILGETIAQIQVYPGDIDMAWYGINPKFFFAMFHRFLGFLEINNDLLVRFT